MDLNGRVAVITGGASGIGRATALALAREGAEIVIADVNEWRLTEAEAEIAALGARVLAVRCDVSLDADVDNLATAALGHFGRIDLLMNNAGVVLRGVLEQISMADWEWVFQINTLGVVRGIRAFLPHMLARGSGYIVNTGSMAGLIALTGEGAPYVASKFAVVGLSEALALYTRPRGIGVSVLCPAGVATNLAETGRSIGFDSPASAAAETALAATLQSTPEMDPADIGRLVVDAVRHDRFLILTHEIHQQLIARRAQDLDGFIADRLRQAGSTT